MTINLKNVSLKWEIIFSLAVKLALLYIIWKVCFSHPIDESLTPDRVGDHMIVSTQKGDSPND